MRAFITVIIAALLAALGAPTRALGARQEPPPVRAAAAILVDAETGQVLYERNADQRRPMASTTKIMTALLILERGDLDAVCTVSEAAAAVEPSAVGLHAGERLPLGDLLTALLVKSANDAAVAAAESVAGSEEAFVTLMNQRARQLGARNTHFVNSHGLYHPQHYSSARDLALITRAAMRRSRFCELVSTRRATMRGGEDDAPRVLINKNKLLYMMPGADGVKTGYVKQSGPCLVASATRGGWRLLAVLLDSPDLWGEARALLEYGFNNFHPLWFARRGEPVASVAVRGGREPQVALVPSSNLLLVVPNGGAAAHDCAPRLDLARPQFCAPLRRGQHMGRIVLTAGNRQVQAANLVAGATVPRSLLASIWVGTSRALFTLVAAAMALRGYSVATKKRRTRRLHVRLTPAQREPKSSVISR